MKKALALLCLGTFLAGTTVVAEEKIYGIDVGLGFNRKQLEYSFIDIDANPIFNTMAINATGFYKNAYIAGEYEILLTDDTNYEAEKGGSVTVLVFERKDANLTAGYNVWRGLSIFGGYKYGATIAVAQPPVQQKIVSSELGPFAGISYGHRLGSGALGISIAYADMDGEVRVKFMGTGTSTDIPGKTRGLSYGLSWSAPLTDQIDYRLGIKVNRYQFKVDDPSQDVLGTSRPAGDFNTDENFTIYSIMLSRQF